MSTILTPPRGDFTMPERKWREAIAQACSALVLPMKDWSPSYSGYLSLNYTATTVRAKYSQLGKVVFIDLIANGTTSGSAEEWVTVSNFPVPAAYTYLTLHGYVVDGPAYPALAYFNTSTSVMVGRGGGNDWGIGVNRHIRLCGTYEAA